MKPYYQDSSGKIYCGDVLDVLRLMESESVQTVITSPPYWRQRDYGVRGQIGLERKPGEYIAKLIIIFHELKRVLRKDGTFWLNIGDKRISGKGHCHNPGGGDRSFQNYLKKNSVLELDRLNVSEVRAIGLKPKDLAMIPARLAIALQSDGWYLRQDIIWHKNNPMPESVTDRPTTAHEHIFLLAKSARYFYDAEAIKEDALRPAESGYFGGEKGRNHITEPDDPNYRNGHEQYGRLHINDSKRNKRSVWTVATQPYPEAHFATFPPKLIEPCIKAGTPEYGCCDKCGAPYERMVKREIIERSESYNGKVKDLEKQHGYKRIQMMIKAGREAGLPHDNPIPPMKTLGWRPTCECNAGIGKSVVLDPFGGSMTTCMVAKSLNRRYVAIDLKAEYIDMGKKRLAQEQLL